ncbi:MAG: hypothetical protein U0235_30720 [Polyangiaceae bacterium]
METPLDDDVVFLSVIFTVVLDASYVKHVSQSALLLLAVSRRAPLPPSNESQTLPLASSVRTKTPAGATLLADDESLHPAATHTNPSTQDARANDPSSSRDGLAPRSVPQGPSLSFSPRRGASAAETLPAPLHLRGPTYSAAAGAGATGADQTA